MVADLFMLLTSLSGAFINGFDVGSDFGVMKALYHDNQLPTNQLPFEVVIAVGGIP